MPKLTIGIFFLNFLGLSSEISTFCWYISFFALAVLTFPFWDNGLKKIKNVWVEIVFIIVMFFALRATGSFLASKQIINEFWHGILSHYFQAMPSLLIGTAVSKHHLFDKISERIVNKSSLVLSIVFLCGWVLVQYILIFVLKITSDIDFIWIAPLMFALTMISKVASKSKWISAVLELLGKYSMYIWLIHAVFLLDIFQCSLYTVRIPMLIVAIAVSGSLGVGVLLDKLDGKIQK